MYKDEIDEILKDAEESLKPKPPKNKHEMTIAMFFIGMLVGGLLAGYACNQSKHSHYIETPSDQP